MASRIEMVAAYERYCEESGLQSTTESRRAWYQAWAVRKIAELEKHLGRAS